MVALVCPASGLDPLPGPDVANREKRPTSCKGCRMARRISLGEKKEFRSAAATEDFIRQNAAYRLATGEQL